MEMLNVESLSAMVCFILLCAACSPSPFAIPLAAFFVWGVTDEMYSALIDLFGGYWGLIAFGMSGAAIVTYWINGLLLLFVGARHPHRCRLRSWSLTLPCTPQTSSSGRKLSSSSRYSPTRRWTSICGWLARWRRTSSSDSSASSCRAG